MIPANAQSAAIKIGLVTPTTGPIAAFGEADPFILAQVAKALGPGIANNGKTYTIQVIAKDCQSSSSRAAEVASELILGEKVDLILASDTPDVTNPVADQAEANEVPCITTVAPWQPYFFGRKGDPKKGFDWTYHFFWGLEDVMAVFTTLWNSAATNKSVGGLFPNDADGSAWGDPKLGFPEPLKAGGFSLVDPGRYQPLSPDFSAQISAFKKANVEIVTGMMIPPDFATFWSQAAQQSFKPKIATISRKLRCCSPRRSRRSAIAATASRPRFGGVRATPSSRASPARPRSNCARPTPRGDGQALDLTRSASNTACSRSRSTR